MSEFEARKRRGVVVFKPLLNDLALVTAPQETTHIRTRLEMDRRHDLPASVKHSSRLLDFHSLRGVNMRNHE